ncbi:MAG: helix-turn-helix domain-containing protein [Oscillospiraceae bacterium]|nr:helix-turn-helix domain-containing protein [Oscillospiraceae bacterium]
MEYDAQVSFLQQLLKGMHISSCIVDDPAYNIPPEIDLGLRAELFCLKNYAPFLQNSMAQATDRTVYRFFDEYDCSYIFLRLPNLTERYFFIGPYLLSLPARERIDRKALSLKLSAEQIQWLHSYYSSLPLVEDENMLLTMANTLAAHLWGTPEQYSMEYVDYAIPDRYDPIPYSPIQHHGNDHHLDLGTLEQNYANENQLIDAVSKGKLHLVTAVAASVFNNGTQPRMTDSLRDRKNNLIILKTLLRKAAEYGGVHPLHIHRLSTYFAAQIENVRTIKQSFFLQEEMIRSYCQLVKQHSLKQYSYYVGQTITLVQYDLTADLRLNTIAKKLNVSSSYLSSLFHKEYGCTLTEYINQQRINYGLTLLCSTARPVQEISAECGFQDVNYFIKLFKKYTGFTPNRYRQQFGNPHSQSGS